MTTVFKLHLDPDYAFSHVLGQNAQILQFDVPREYYISTSSGVCNFDTSSAQDGTILDTLDLSSHSSKFGQGVAPGTCDQSVTK